MARRRVEGTVSEANYEYFENQCQTHVRGPSEVLDHVLTFARLKGLDLSSGQARELAESLGGKR